MRFSSIFLFLFSLLIYLSDCSLSFAPVASSNRRQRHHYLAILTKETTDDYCYSRSFLNPPPDTWTRSTQMRSTGGLGTTGTCLQLYPSSGGFGGGSGGGGTTKKKNKKKQQTKKTDKSTTATANTRAPPTPATTTVYRRDYCEPTHLVTHVSLNFNIVHDNKVIVTSTMTVKPNPDGSSGSSDVNYVLDGDSSTIQLKQVSVLVDDGESGKKIQKDLVDGVDYKLSSDALHMKLHTLQNHANENGETVLQTIVELSSFEVNKKELSGLYRRDGMFVTHCEPTGFRRITYFPDRPDNTAIFRVRIEAPKDAYPLLLSNGNHIESGDIDFDRHYVVFEDPHPKPSYIFGLVAAGNLASLSDTYTTASGREVALRIYSSEVHSISRLTFALDTLKRSMAWDEETYGLEYDLDVYNVLAAQHFVLGAMENKGLNIFQTSLIATDPQSTTDVTYDLVEKTVAHEYLHNWSGNRVTVRDWFEFSLKEGLTVYRDQEFTADVGLRTITRIEAVKILREKQFREDASEDRHPIRPESASASREHTLDALASSTTYHKGAEVCRMYKSILGKEGFRKGLRLYMKRNDGAGATCDDFRNAMADANDVNFDQFALWYSTAGTPTISYKHSYDKQKKTFSLTLTQNLEHTPDVLLHIPVLVGLLDKESGDEVLPTTTLELKKRTETFEFKDLDGDVIPSILRDFSAPVILVSENEAEEEDATHGFLATYDTDGFNRWEAIQKLYANCIFGIMLGAEEAGDTQAAVFKAFENTLNDETIDPASKSYLLNLPTESILSRQLEVESPGSVHRARQELGRRIHNRYNTQLRELYDRVTASIPDGEVRTDTQSRATRAFRNVLLDLLCYTGDENDNERKAAANLAMKHLDDATCLTDRLAAFRKLSSMSGVASDARDEAIKKFYLFAKESDPIVMHKWFQTQALTDLSDALDRVKILTQHPDFKATNAGRFRSLITAFTMNARAFHDEGGEGYKFIGSVITQMDAVAPQLAIELANKLALWRRHDSVRASMMKAELKRIASSKKISRGLSLTVQRALS